MSTETANPTSTSQSPRSAQALTLPTRNVTPTPIARTPRSASPIREALLVPVAPRIQTEVPRLDLTPHAALLVTRAWVTYVPELDAASAHPAMRAPHEAWNRSNPWCPNHGEYLRRLSPVRQIRHLARSCRDQPRPLLRLRGMWSLVHVFGRKQRTEGRLSRS